MKHDVERKKPDTKDQILYCVLHLCEMQADSVVQGVTASGNDIGREDENVLELDGGGHATL